MPEILPYAPAVPRRTGWLRWFEPDPAIPIRVTDPAAVAAEYRRGQWRGPA